MTSETLRTTEAASRMTHFLTKHLAWLLPAVCLIYIASNMFRASRPSEGFDFQGFGTLPVVSNGRVQPLDSLARNTLLAIHAKQKSPVKAHLLLLPHGLRSSPSSPRSPTHGTFS